MTHRVHILHSCPDCHTTHVGGLPIYDAFPPEDQSQIGTIAQQVSHEAWQGTLTYLRSDGTRFPGQISAFPIFDAHNQLYVLAALVTDITQIKQAEAERTALQQQIIDAQQSAIRELSRPLLSTPPWLRCF